MDPQIKGALDLQLKFCPIHGSKDCNGNLRGEDHTYCTECGSVLVGEIKLPERNVLNCFLHGFNTYSSMEDGIIRTCR